ncbi:photosystem II reaction center protein H [Striga asiatica]|uniref:Photosystem II reaction center protein H n=1 Tax=Striga asiatica TaxID=4170 RepID=A0A5A7QZK7_STRAF|nr:photosystem II reaction center protein H [Striga asiatica]
MSYQAAKSEVARSLMEDMFEQNMDKIYEASMREETSKDGDILKNVESAIGNLKGSCGDAEYQPPIGGVFFLYRIIILNFYVKNLAIIDVSMHLFIVEHPDMGE